MNVLHVFVWAETFSWQSLSMIIDIQLYMALVIANDRQSLKSCESWISEAFINL